MQFLFFFWGCDKIGNLSYEVEVLKTYSIPPAFEGLHIWDDQFYPHSPTTNATTEILKNSYSWINDVFGSEGFWPYDALWRE